MQVVIALSAIMALGFRAGMWLERRRQPRVPFARVIGEYQMQPAADEAERGRLIAEFKNMSRRAREYKREWGRHSGALKDFAWDMYRDAEKRAVEAARKLRSDGYDAVLDKEVFPR